MNVQLLIDMNLSVEWVAELNRHGWSAVHWSIVGDPSAEDSVIMKWALANGYVVFTHDLDFGTMLALTHANGPVSCKCAAKTFCQKTLAASWSLRCVSTTPPLRLVLWSSSI